MVDGAMAIIEIHDGRQLAAARALAGLGIRELAAAASVTVRTLHRLETGGVIQVAQKKRHGCVQRDLWVQIVAALASAGVELLPQGASFGAGVRYGAAGAAAGRRHIKKKAAAAWAGHVSPARWSDCAWRGVPRQWDEYRRRLEPYVTEL
jgi:hypothetical protein